MKKSICTKKAGFKPILLTAASTLMFFLPANSFAQDPLATVQDQPTTVQDQPTTLQNQPTTVQDQPTTRGRLVTFDLGFTGAKRIDQFDWNIASSMGGTSPNILSELTWTDLEIYEVGVNGRLLIIRDKALFGGVVKGNATYGEIQSGENQDSDYEFNNRTGEWSRSNNRADHGETWDTQLSGGMIFRSRNRMFSVSPQLGYSLHIQHLAIHDGYQTLSGVNPFGANPPPVGPITGLDSKYDAEWLTGFFGLDLEFKPSSNFELYGGIEFHSGRYYAEADWNLRTDFRHPVSFTHKSEEAYGVVTNAGLRFGHENILFHLEIRYRNFTAENGVDRTYFNNGTIGVTRVNEVNWESASVGGGVTFRF